MDDKVWSRVLAALEPTVSRPNFSTWLKPSKLVSEQNGLITVAVPSAYAKNWVEKNVLGEISKILSQEVGAVEKIVLVIGEPVATKPLNELPLLQQIEQHDPGQATSDDEDETLFNNRYTFENFIVGNNNRLAFAAAQAVAERPGEAYNPLFLYGGVGLGKTHLMHAIGSDILRRFPKKKIIYTTCEIFTSEFIHALQNNKINQFKKKYRTVDVFLIDDIQFLVNKEGTQEEFFHTFNILHQSNRQIVITSDRTPREITKLEDRLTSRLGWGMIADVQSPNLETRAAILHAKAEEKGVDIDPGVLEYVASIITSNVRELEGSLIKLVTTAQIEGQPITKEYAKKVLKDLANPTGGDKLTSKQVIKAIAQHFDIEVTDLLGKKRIKELVYPRQLVMYLLREQLHQSYPQIGEVLGGKDHTTVMHGVNKITKELKENNQIEADLSAVRQGLIK